jgi:hypothetical protein
VLGCACRETTFGGWHHEDASATGKERDVAKEKDPAEIVQTIAQSIRVSQRGARRVRAHRFKELFGYQVLNAQRREKIEQLLAEAGIEVRPSLEEAKRDDWLVMSMPVEVPVHEASPDPAPTPEWFAHMASVRTDTEREVEMHFASPLFREGEPLVLVECKRLIKDEKELLAAAAQAHSYALWAPGLLRDHRRQDRQPVGLPGRYRSRQGTTEGAPG